MSSDGLRAPPPRGSGIQVGTRRTFGVGGDEMRDATDQEGVPKAARRTLKFGRSGGPHVTEEQALRFERFEIQPLERQLLVDGRPASLGARAFDLRTA